MKAIIFHGWGASSKDNWFPWLKSELEKKGHEVYCPDLPNTQSPIQKEWLNVALNLTEYDENTILIGHSLGTVLIMRILEKINKKIKAAFLVSSFDEDLGIPEINNFFDQPFDYEKIKSNKLYMLSSDNDPYIPLPIAERLSKNLNCKLTVFKAMEHLSQGTDNFKFPELRDLILNESH